MELLDQIRGRLGEGRVPEVMALALSEHDVALPEPHDLGTRALLASALTDGDMAWANRMEVTGEDELWAEACDHVVDVRLDEMGPGLVMAMDEAAQSLVAEAYPDEAGDHAKVPLVADELTETLVGLLSADADEAMASDEVRVAIRLRDHVGANERAGKACATLIATRMTLADLCPLSAALHDGTGSTCIVHVGRGLVASVPEYVREKSPWGLPSPAPEQAIDLDIDASDVAEVSSPDADPSALVGRASPDFGEGLAEALDGADWRGLHSWTLAVEGTVADGMDVATHARAIREDPATRRWQAPLSVTDIAPKLER